MAFVTTASDDDSLSALTISEGTLTPAFATGTYAYTATVNSGVSSVTITATATDSGATVSGDTGTQSLSVGVNNFTVTVTAENSDTQDYTLAITRKPAVSAVTARSVGDEYVQVQATLGASYTGTVYYRYKLSSGNSWTSASNDTVTASTSSDVVISGLTAGSEYDFSASTNSDYSDDEEATHTHAGTIIIYFDVVDHDFHQITNITDITNNDASVATIPSGWDRPLGATEMDGWFYIVNDATNHLWRSRTPLTASSYTDLGEIGSSLAKIDGLAAKDGVLYAFSKDVVYSIPDPTDPDDGVTARGLPQTVVDADSWCVACGSANVGGTLYFYFITNDNIYRVSDPTSPSSATAVALSSLPAGFTARTMIEFNGRMLLNDEPDEDLYEITGFSTDTSASAAKLGDYDDTSSNVTAMASWSGDPAAIVQNIGSTNLAQTTATITVTATKADSSGQTFYTRYREDGSGTAWADANVAEATSTTTQAQINLTGLTHSTQYEFQASMDENFPSDDTSSTNTFTTAAGGDPTITSATVTNVTGTGATLTVTTANPGGEAYTIHWSRTGGSGTVSDTHTTALATTQSFPQVGLLNSTTYTITVTLDPGDAEEVVTFTTPGLAVSPFPGSIARDSNETYTVGGSTTTANWTITGAGTTIVIEADAADLDCSDASPETTISAAASVSIRGCTNGTATLTVTDSTDSTISREYTLTVQDQEGVVDSVTMSAITSTTATATIALTNPHSQSTTVYARYTPSGGSPVSLTSQDTTGTSLTFSLSSLTPATEYTVEAGTSSTFAESATQSATFTTLTAPTISGVTTPTITGTGATVRVAIADSGTDSVTVYVRWDEDGQTSWNALTAQSGTDVNFDFSITGLTNGQAYDVQASLASDYSSPTSHEFTTSQVSLSPVPSGLSNNTNYEYTVNGAGSSGVNVTATDGTGSVTIATSENGLNCTSRATSLTGLTGNLWMRTCTTGAATLVITDADDSTTTTSYSLTIGASPGTITGVQASNVDTDSADITVSLANPDSVTTRIYGRYREAGEGWNDITIPTTTGTSQTVTLSSLDDDTTYDVQVSTDDTFPSTDRYEVSFTTQEEAAITGLTITAITGTTATATVTLTNPDSLEVTISFRHAVDGTTTYTTATAVTQSNADDVVFSLTGLNNGTTYQGDASLSSTFSPVTSQDFTTRQITLTPTPVSVQRDSNQEYTIGGAGVSTANISLTGTGDPATLATAEAGLDCTSITTLLTGVSGSFWLRGCAEGSATVTATDAGDSTVSRGYSLTIGNQPGSISSFTFGTITNTSIAYTVNLDNPHGETVQVYVRRSVAGADTWTTVLNQQVTGTSYSSQSTNLAAGTTYDYHASSGSTFPDDGTRVEAQATTTGAAIRLVDSNDVQPDALEFIVGNEYVFTVEGSPAVVYPIGVTILNTDSSIESGVVSLDQADTCANTDAEGQGGIHLNENVYIDWCTAGTYNLRVQKSGVATHIYQDIVIHPTPSVAIDPDPSSTTIARLSDYEFDSNVTSSVQNYDINLTDGTGSGTLSLTENGLDCSSRTTSLSDVPSADSFWFRGCTLGGTDIEIEDADDSTVSETYSATVSNAVVSLTDLSSSSVGLDSADIDLTLSNPDSVSTTVYMRYQENEAGSWQPTQSDSITAAAKTFSLTGLDSNTTYNVEAALNSAFTGALTHSFTTPAEGIALTSVTASDEGPTTATVTVILTNPDSQSAAIHIRYRTPATGSGAWTTFPTSVSVSSSSDTEAVFSLTGLTSGSTYRVQASVGDTFSTTVQDDFTTLSPEVSSVSLDSTTRTSATFTAAISNNDGIETTYYYRYRTPPTTGTYGSGTSFTGTGASVSFSIGSLQENTQYELEASRTATFPGATTATVTFTTVSNSAPSFPSSQVAISVNDGLTAGAVVGSPITATDAENDALTYGLSGSGASSFDVGTSTGQITVAAGVTLMHSTQSTYSLTLTATDTHMATGTVDVTVSVLPPPPTPVPEAEGAAFSSSPYLGSVHLVVNASSNLYGYSRNDYGRLTAGELPRELFDDNIARQASLANVDSTTNTLRLEYLADEDDLFREADNLEWIRVQVRAADNTIIGEGLMWTATSCASNALCVDIGANLDAQDGEAVAVDFFDAVREVLFANPGGEQAIVMSAADTGSDSTGFDDSNGYHVGGHLQPEWFTDGELKPVSKLLLRHGSSNRVLELEYDDTEAVGLWRYDPELYRKFRLTVYDRAGNLLMQINMAEALERQSESERRCGDGTAQRRICLPYDYADFDGSLYRGQMVLMQVEDLTWFVMLQATPGGPIGAALGLGLFGAIMSGVTFRKTRSPQREWIILAFGAIASALPSIFGYGDIFWAGAILIIAVLAGTGWHFASRSR